MDEHAIFPPDLGQLLPAGDIGRPGFGLGISKQSARESSKYAKTDFHENKIFTVIAPPTHPSPWSNFLHPVTYQKMPVTYQKAPITCHKLSLPSNVLISTTPGEDRFKNFTQIFL
jgi:hypothetical protein